MKLFQQLLVAPAALGLVAPMAAGAADLNMAGVSQYSSQEQVTSISQFSDVKPTDWAYQALSNLIERYGCVAGYPNGTYKGGQAMTRFEAAALLNACLDRVTEVTDELKRLMKEFEKELAILKGRVDGLEARVGELEANQFSTTTKLKGIATFVLGANSFGGNNTFLTQGAKAFEGGTSFNYDVRLNFDTSFTGKDLLRTTLRAGNFANSAFGAGGGGEINPLNSLEVAFQEACGLNGTPNGTDCGDVVAVNRLFYQFPVGKDFTVTFGGKVRQDDMLAMWPSAYPADTVLDIFTYAGAPGAYNLNLGAGAGIWYKKNNWSVSANYVAANGDNGTPGTTCVLTAPGQVCNPANTIPGGGIGTSYSQQTGTVQVGYAASNWGAAAAYNYSRNLGPAAGTPFSQVSTLLGSAGINSTIGATNTMNSVGLSAYWQPSTNGWVPSISAGWGLNGYSGADTAFAFGGVQSQSWYVGLQWNDAFIKGNALGMGFGQPTFITSYGNNTNVKNALGNTPQDGNYAWEWWYKFQVTDNISVTPAIYYLSNPLGSFGFQTNQNTGFSPASAALTNFGGIVKTTFKF
jgi:hypothetical protein